MFTDEETELRKQVVEAIFNNRLLSLLSKYNMSSKPRKLLAPQINFHASASHQLLSLLGHLYHLTSSTIELTD